MRRVLAALGLFAGLMAAQFGLGTGTPAAELTRSLTPHCFLVAGEVHGALHVANGHEGAVVDVSELAHGRMKHAPAPDRLVPGRR